MRPFRSTVGLLDPTDSSSVEKNIEQDTELASPSSRFASSSAYPIHDARSSNGAISVPMHSSYDSVIKYVLWQLMPSFAHPILRPEPSAPVEQLRATAYLDGMRGVASFIVFMSHLSYTCFRSTVGFGSGGIEENNYYLIQLPIIRLFYSGPASVTVFFIISGYALSYKPIKLIRSQRFDALLLTLSSSTFRRGFRLFLPCFASTFIVFMMIRLGIYEYTRPILENKNLVRHFREAHPERLDSFTAQLWQYCQRMFDFVHPWDFFIYGGTTDYDHHLWTIPVEFRASIVLFMTHLVVARFTTAARFILIILLNFWALQWDRWEINLFWFGSMFAELDQIMFHRYGSQHRRNASGGVVLWTARERAAWWAWTLTFVIGMYLMSYPEEGARSTPGYRYLAAMVPGPYAQEYRHWQSVGALLIMWATMNSEVLKSMFTGPAFQYLGKISFALYLVHGPVIHSFGFATMPIWWQITGLEPRFNYELGFFFYASGVIVFAIWMADLFWRFVDIPCIKFARWLERKVIIEQ